MPLHSSGSSLLKQYRPVNNEMAAVLSQNFLVAVVPQEVVQNMTFQPLHVMGQPFRQVCLRHPKNSTNHDDGENPGNINHGIFG